MSQVRSRRTAALAVVLALVAAARPAAAQQPDTLVVVSTVPEATQRDVVLPGIDRPTSPGGAFVRSLVLPGWGQAAIGAYTRAGFYFAAQSTTAFLLARSARRLSIAKDGRDLREDRLRAALLAEGVTGDSVDVRLATDPAVARSRRFVDSRRQQLEDWVALGVFVTFLSAADAFVSAHLRDFPEPIAIELAPPPGGGLAVARVGVRISLGPPRRER